MAVVVCEGTLRAVRLRDVVLQNLPEDLAVNVVELKKRVNDE